MKHPIPERVDPEEMALPVNGKKRGLDRRDFEAFARTSGLNEKQAQNSFERITRKVPEMIAFLRKGFLPPKRRRNSPDLSRPATKGSKTEPQNTATLVFGFPS